MSATTLYADHETNTDADTDRSFHTDVDILLIDDDEQWAWATAQLLESTDEAFVVETALSQKSGIEQFRETPPDCIVCDYQLGDGTGLDLLDTVRETHPHLPFILITGRGDEHVASDALGRGATDYIPKDTDDDEGTLLASRVRRIVHAYRTERQLERERQSKNALLDVVTTRSNLSELHEQCCQVLVDVHEFDGVWIGMASDDGVVPEAVAGCQEYLDTAVPAETDVDTGDPGLTAISTTEPVFESVDPTADDEWHQLAHDHDITAAAAVPIRSESRLFGVIAVYTADPITSQQRDLLEEFAELLGYVHRTAEWKQSLLSGPSVQIEIELTDESVPLVTLADRLSEGTTVEIPSVVDRNDGTVAYLARIQGATADELESVCADCPAVELADYTRESGTIRCDLRTASETPEQLLTDRNMYFGRTTIDSGTVTVSGQLTDIGAVQRVTQLLESQYDGVTISTVWSDSGADRSPKASDDLLDSLTDRQLEALRHAYFDNYYQIPRGVSATELAERFDIARATFTQHLRTAERKIFTQLFVDG